MIGGKTLEKHMENELKEEQAENVMNNPNFAEAVDSYNIKLSKALDDGKKDEEHMKSIIDFNRSEINAQLNGLEFDTAKDNTFSDGFYGLLEQMKEIHRAKNADYAGDDAYSNFKQCEKIGIPAWKGSIVRMGDKWSRIENLVNVGGEGQVKDESIEDTLIDLANYAIITIILRRKDMEK